MRLHRLLPHQVLHFTLPLITKPPDTSATTPPQQQVKNRTNTTVTTAPTRSRPNQLAPSRHVLERLWETKAYETHDSSSSSSKAARRAKKMKNQRCWLFTEIADEKRITQGNAGYADETGVIYRYDNSVPNHKNPAEGDIVILRKGHEALGWALICGIKKDIGSKERRRCPECKKTKVRLRKTMSPQWWCTECRIDFEKPIISFEPAVLYEAHFNGTFNSLKKEIPLSTLWRHAKK